MTQKKTKATSVEVAVLIDPKEYGLETKDVASVAKAFQPKITERDGYIPLYDELIKKEYGPETVKEARELRLKLVKVRTGIAAVHTTQKAFFLAAGKYVDAWKNKETLPVTQMEEVLSEIEDRAAEAERLRLSELQDSRVELLSQYVEDANERDLSSMDEDVWEAFLATKQNDYKIKQEREAKAEKERLAEEERIAGIAKLNTSRLQELAPYWGYLTDEQKSENHGEVPQEYFDEFLAGMVAMKDESDKKAEAELEKKKKENDAVAKQAATDKLAREKAEKEASDARVEASIAEKKNADLVASVAKNKERQQQLFDLGFEYKDGAFLMDGMIISPDIIPAESDANWDVRMSQTKEQISIAAELEDNKGEEVLFAEFIAELKGLREKYDFPDGIYNDAFTESCEMIDRLVVYVCDKL